MALLRLTDVRPDAEIEKLLKSTVADAEVDWEPLKYEGHYPAAGFGITELRPRVLKEGSVDNFPSTQYWAASIAASLTWQSWFDLTLTDMAYVMPTGVFNSEVSPMVTELRPSANGIDLPTVNIEQLYVLDLARAWFEKPYCARPGNNIKNRLVARNSGVERIGLMGFMIAKRAYLILE